MTGGVGASRPLVLLALAQALLLAALLLGWPSLPLQDGPGHVAVVDLLARLERGDPAVAAVFERRPLAPIYAAFYAFGGLVVPLLGPEGALRALLGVYLVAWAVCLWVWLGRDPDPRRRWLVLLAAPAVLHGVLYFGFVNMLLAYPLVAAGLRCASPRRPMPARARALWLAGLASLACILHPLGWAAWALAVGVAALVAPPGPGPRALWLLPLLAPLPPVLGWSWLATREARWGAYAGLPALRWYDPVSQVAGAAHMLLPVVGPGQLLQALGLSMAVALVALDRRRDPTWAAEPERRACAWAAAAAAAAGCLGPFWVGEVNFVGQRLLPLVPLLLLGALPPRLAEDARGRAALGAAGLALLAGHAWAFVSWEREVGPALRLGAAQPPGLRVLGMVLSPHARAAPALDHLVGVPLLLGVRRGWVPLQLWATAHLPLAYLDPPELPPAMRPQDMPRATVLAADVVLVYARADDPPAGPALDALLGAGGALEGAALLEQAGEWRLYRAPR